MCREEKVHPPSLFVFPPFPACYSPVRITDRLAGFLDRIRTIDRRPRLAELIESSNNDDQRREAHAYSGYMLGKLYAASPTESIQSERQPIPCADGRWEG